MMDAFNILFIFFVAFLTFQNSFTAPANEKDSSVKLDIQKNAIEELLRITSFKSEEDGQFAESLGSAWKNEGLVTADGIIQEQKFRKALLKEFQKEFPRFVAEDKAQEVVTYCKNVKGKNAAETSVNMVKCLGKWKTQSFIEYEREQSY